MKNCTIFIRPLMVILMTFLTATGLFAQFGTSLFYDDFETNSIQSTKWTQSKIVGSVLWGTGSHQTSSGYFCASISSTSSTPIKTDLITAAFDLKSFGYTSGTLSFLVSIPLKINSFDNLTVMCRTTATGAWTNLQTINLTAGWYPYSITIPKALFSTTTQIGFRASCSSAGLGIYLDDISISAMGGGVTSFNGKTSNNLKECTNYTNGCPSALADTFSTDVPSRVWDLRPTLFSGDVMKLKNMTIGVTTYYGMSKSPLAITAPVDIYGEMILSGNLTVKFPGVVTVKSGGKLTVLGTITVTGPSGSGNSTLIIENNGSLITGCNIVYLPYNQSPYSGTGYPIVQRKIPQDLKWHFLSSPVYQQAIANKDFAPAPNTFLQVPNTEWDFYRWMTTCPDPPFEDHWRNLRNVDGTQNYMDFGYPSYFNVSEGYLVAYSNYHGSSSVFVNNETKIFNGPLNSCCTGFDFHNEISECPYFWNLIGNPFTSAISWDKVQQKYNLYEDYYYIYNDNKAGGAGYEFWADSIRNSGGVDGYIPPMQGFFVSVLTEGGRFLELPTDARVHHNSSDIWLKSSPSNKLTITLGNGTNFDEAFLVFGNQNNSGLDRSDALKMFSLVKEIPQVYTLVSDVKTALNALPLTDSPITIPVGFAVPADGNYSLKISGLSQLSGSAACTLEDLQTHTVQDLRQNPEYNFFASGYEDAGRFLLHFNGPISINDHPATGSVSISSYDRTVFISGIENLRNAQVTVCNLLGQEIATKPLAGISVNQINLNVPKGYYIVRVKDDSSITVQKVFIN